ncbi:MAG TPA: DMT family transporter [Caulobacteraceae bacterium]|jgi:drug/metabolite transporter (DMT)-like permease
MFGLLWVPVTIGASAFQVARNAFQRGMMGATGPWGATLSRFLFGLPFSIAFTAVAWAFTPAARPHLTAEFWWPGLTGAAAQVLATASLLVAMRRAGFAVGTAMQQSSVPLSAIVGLAVFHDNLAPGGWLGVAITTCGLAVLTWPHRDQAGEHPVSGAFFALLSGLFFGFSLNAFHHAGRALDPEHALFSALMCVTIVQAAQASALGLYLAVRDPRALVAVVIGWRQSLAAGFCGAVASSGWFLALNLAAAAPVRSVGVIEMPMAAIAGRRVFSEQLTVRQVLAGAAVLAGVVMTALS